MCDFICEGELPEFLCGAYSRMSCIANDEKLTRMARQLVRDNAFFFLHLGLYVEEDVENSRQTIQTKRLSAPCRETHKNVTTPNGLRDYSRLVRFYAAVAEIFHGLDDCLVYLKFSIALHL